MIKTGQCVFCKLHKDNNDKHLLTSFERAEDKYFKLLEQLPEKKNKVQINFLQELRLNYMNLLVMVNCKKHNFKK